MIRRTQATLLTHVDAHELPFERLADYKPPPGTRTWKPIAHADFAKVVREVIDRRDYAILRERYAVTKDGRRMFGVFDLTRRGMCIANGSVGLSIGIRNSVDKTIAGTILGGERVFVCNNLAFSTKLAEIRKHTRHFRRDLEAKVNIAIARCEEHVDDVSRKVHHLKATECSDDRACGIIIDAAQSGACRWRDIPKVIKAWRFPSYYEFQARSAWSLYNAFTEVGKDWFASNPQQAVAASLKLNSLAAFVGVN